LSKNFVPSLYSAISLTTPKFFFHLPPKLFCISQKSFSMMPKFFYPIWKFLYLYPFFLLPTF
jgi:hypothetical protein